MLEYYLVDPYLDLSPLLLRVLVSAVLLSAVIFVGVAIIDPHPGGPRRRQAVLVLSLGVFFLLGLFSYAVLENFPNSGDEHAYLVQAETLANFRLWDPAPQLAEYFATYRIVERNGRWLTQYPPGWPLMLAGAMLIRFPAGLVNPLLGALTLLVLFLLGKRSAGERAGLAAGLALALSPFFIFNSSSYFAHPSCAFFVLAGYYWLSSKADADHEGCGGLAAFAAGFCLAYAVIIRYLSAAACAIPLVLGWMLRLRQRPSCGRALALCLLGAAFPLCFDLYYNHAITGHALVEPFTYRYFSGASFTEATLENSWAKLWTFKRLILLLLWVSPILVLLYLGNIAASIASRRLYALDWVPVALVCAYHFFPSDAGNEYGPRYFYEAFPFMLLSIASMLYGDRFRVLENRPRLHFALQAAFAAGIVGGLIFLPSYVRSVKEVIWERKDLYRLVEEQHLHRSVVLVKAGTGVKSLMHPGDLVRNNRALNNDILFARYVYRQPCLLRTIFPDRSFYLYDRRGDEVRGWLSEICPTVPVPHPSVIPLKPSVSRRIRSE